MLSENFLTPGRPSFLFLSFLSFPSFGFWSASEAEGDGNDKNDKNDGHDGARKSQQTRAGRAASGKHLRSSDEHLRAGSLRGRGWPAEACA